MALGAYGSETARGSVLNALAHPTVVNPLAALQGAVQTAQGVVGLKQAQFNLQQAQLAPVYQSMRMLIATNPNPSQDDILAALGGAARLNGNTDGVTANLTDWTSRGGKPADFVRAYAMGGMSPENQALMGVGQPFSQDTGAGTVYGMRGGPLSAQPGAVTPSGFIQRTLTPAEASDFVTIQTSQGPVTVTRGSLLGSGGGAAGGAGTGAGAAVNNFGNIRAPGGGFASFNTPQDGIAAMTGLLRSYQDQQGINTLNGITARWAPKGDGANDPVAYANTISKLTGIDPNAKLDLHDPATLAKIIPAMAQVEHGRPMIGPGDVLSAGISAGLGGNTAAAGPGGGQGGQQPYQVASNAPVAPPSVAQPGAGAGANVRPAGGVQGYDAYGRPIGAGGGGGGPQIPGVTYTPQGPVIQQPSSWMNAIWEQSAKEYSGDLSKEAGLASRIQPWQSALSIIDAHPDLKTGPTSQQWNNWATTLSQYGVNLPSQPGDTTAAYQELSKALHQGLLNSGAFSGTDMARINAEASMPNTQQKVDAIRELAARQIGLERFDMARLKYFRSLHPGEDPDQYANQYRSQTSQWAANLDPVAFGADHLTDQDIATYLKGLSPADQQRFRNSVKEAAKLYPDFAKAGQ